MDRKPEYEDWEVMKDPDDINELVGRLSQAKVELDILIGELVILPETINWGADRIYDVTAHLTNAQGIWDRISYKGIAEDGV